MYTYYLPIWDAPKMVCFSQLLAVKKDIENCAPGNFFGPSYFVTILPEKPVKTVNLQYVDYI